MATEAVSGGSHRSSENDDRDGRSQRLLPEEVYGLILGSDVMCVWPPPLISRYHHRTPPVAFGGGLKTRAFPSSR